MPLLILFIFLLFPDVSIAGILNFRFKDNQERVNYRLYVDGVEDTNMSLSIDGENPEIKYISTFGIVDKLQHVYCATAYNETEESQCSNTARSTPLIGTKMRNVKSITQETP